MTLGSVSSTAKGRLTLRETLDLAHIYLEKACHAPNADIALLLCRNVEESLSLAKKYIKSTTDVAERNEVVSVYVGLGDVLFNRGHKDKAADIYKKSKKWR